MIEKNIEERMYVCVKLSQSAVPQRFVQHCKSAVLQ